MEKITGKLKTKPMRIKLLSTKRRRKKPEPNNTTKTTIMSEQNNKVFWCTPLSHAAKLNLSHICSDKPSRTIWCHHLNTGSDNLMTCVVISVYHWHWTSLYRRAGDRDTDNYQLDVAKSNQSQVSGPGDPHSYNNEVCNLNLEVWYLHAILVFPDSSWLKSISSKWVLFPKNEFSFGCQS